MELNFEISYVNDGLADVVGGLPSTFTLIERIPIVFRCNVIKLHWVLVTLVCVDS